MKIDELKDQATDRINEMLLRIEAYPGLTNKNDYLLKAVDKWIEVLRVVE
jgi:hypothetical protein